MRKALRNNKDDGNQEREGAIRRLRAEHDRLEKRLDALYTDKLDGEIDAEYYRKKSAQWYEQIAQITDRITQYQRITRTYTAEGLQVFEYAVSAQSMFESADSMGKRKLLKFVLSNSKFDDGKIVAKFRKPFDLPTETNTAVTGLKGSNGTIQAKNRGMAEREGFEPSRRLPAHTLSRRAP